ncbi:hypothetical protein K438DRAFT_1746951 [Mycena galopus ATCC 62051]|nr:hypothetical protein K438DRAFT_1746951 [Mycena galopus ATCC 62051]
MYADGKPQYADGKPCDKRCHTAGCKRDWEESDRDDALSDEEAKKKKRTRGQRSGKDEQRRRRGKRKKEALAAARALASPPSAAPTITSMDLAEQRPPSAAITPAQPPSNTNAPAALPAQTPPAPQAQPVASSSRVQIGDMEDGEVDESLAWGWEDEDDDPMGPTPFF